MGKEEEGEEGSGVGFPLDCASLLLPSLRELYLVPLRPFNLARWGGEGGPHSDGMAPHGFAEDCRMRTGFGYTKTISYHDPFGPHADYTHT